MIKLRNKVSPVYHDHLLADTQCLTPIFFMIPLKAAVQKHLFCNSFLFVEGDLPNCC